MATVVPLPGTQKPHSGHGGHANHTPSASPYFDKLTGPTQRRTNLTGMKTKQVQRLLRARGYDVVVDGHLGPKTKTAMDAYIKGKPPAQYNTWAAKHFGSVVEKGANPHTVAAGGPGVVSGAGGGHPDPVGGHAPKPSGGSKGSGGSIMSQLLDLLGQGGKIGTMLDPSTADDIAGMQYDADINDTKHELDLLPAQTAQDLKDIDSWYGQVLDSEAQATSADKAANDAGKASIADASKAILSSLGGSANQGANPVAAEGANAEGTIAALGAAQDFYDQQLRPILQNEQAGEKSKENASASEKRAALLQKLSDLNLSRGQAKSAALEDILGKNNDLAQTRFNNRASILNSLAGLQLSGEKIKASLLAAAAKANKPLSPTQLAKVGQSALSQFLDGQGHVDQGQLSKMGVRGAVRAVNNAYLAAGLDLSNPQIAQSAMGVLRQLGITPDPTWYGL